MPLAVIIKALNVVHPSLALFLAGPLLLAEWSGRCWKLISCYIFPIVFALGIKTPSSPQPGRGRRFQTGPGAYKQTSDMFIPTIDTSLFRIN